MEIETAVFRMFLTFFLAILFGFESQRSHKPVGFGTFAFVAVGSCVLAIISLGFGGESNLPILGAIISGIGFLGAGALIKTSDKVFGFMTAASIWLFSIFGIIIGLGHYSLGAVLYCFAWFCVLVDRYLEKENIGGYQKKLNVKIKNEKNEAELDNLLQKYKIKKYRLISKEIDKKEKTVIISYLIEGSGISIRRFFYELQRSPNFIKFSLQ